MRVVTDSIKVGDKTYEASQTLCENGGGDAPSGTIDINSNGKHDVYNYAEANVNVPVPDLSQTTAETYDVAKGKYFYDKEGDKVEGTLVDRLQWVCNNIKSLANEFQNYKGSGLEEMLNGLDTSKVTNLSYTFSNVTGEIDLSSFNFGSVITATQTFLNCSNLIGLPNKFGAALTNADNLLSGCKRLPAVPEMDLSKIKLFSNFYMDCNLITSIPEKNQNMPKMNNFYQTFRNCSSLVELKNIKMPQTSIQNCYYTFAGCTSLKTIQTIDAYGIAHDITNMFDGCTSLETLTIKNLRTSLNVKQCVKMTDETLVGISQEAFDLTGSTRKTLTVPSTIDGRFDAIYVKLITATEEMIAEDPYINNKKPCEVCESTDEGAMTLREYVVSKNWAIAN